VNLAEEAHTPARLLPWAIGLTLVLATVLYVAVMIVALALVSPVELRQSTAPLGLVFSRATGLAPTGVAVIAVAATFNGIIAQIILAARVLYGLAQQGALPHWLGHVSPVTRTPLAATGLSAALVVSVSLGAPVDALADMSARLMLLVFLAVNAALLALKWNGDPAPVGTFVVPMAVPLAGCLLCAALLLLGILI
jgi:basic amino acid/polyamine antiporter, APA family